MHPCIIIPLATGLNQQLRLCYIMRMFQCLNKLDNFGFRYYITSCSRYKIFYTLNIFMPDPIQCVHFKPSLCQYQVIRKSSCLLLKLNPPKSYQCSDRDCLDPSIKRKSYFSYFIMVTLIRISFKTR